MSDTNRDVKGRSGQKRQARTATKKDSAGLDMTTLLGIGVVVIVAALGISLAMGLFDSNTSAANAIQETADATIDGEALPAFDSANPGADAAQGMPAPNVSGQDFAGDDTDLLVEGEANLLVFLAHWCPHCQAELPLLVDEWAGGLPDGVNATAVITSQDPNQANYPPSSWMSREEWDFPVILDDETNSIAGSYGLSGYPYFVVVGADGNVAARTSGELGRDQIQALVDVAAGTADASTVEGSTELSDADADAPTE